MQDWVRSKFDIEEIDGIGYAIWVAENGMLSRSPVDFIVQKFAGVDTSYAAFANTVETPVENPLDNGVNWGNHVRAWQEQGKFA